MNQSSAQPPVLDISDALVRYGHDAVVGLTPTGVVTSWNPAAQRIFGLAEAEAIGRPLHHCLSGTPAGELMALLEKLSRGELAIDQDLTYFRPTGSPLEMAVTLLPARDHGGNVGAALLLIRDVSETRKTRETLARERFFVDTLLENIPDHIYFKNRQSQFLRINPAMAARFGLRRPEDAIGKSDADFFTSEHAQRALADEHEIMRSGHPMINREEKETWPDGSISWVSTTKQCLRDQNGKVIGTFGISRDITDRKRAEEALAQKAQELARSNAELEQFAYAASHDLQEPLRMIASYTQLLARRYQDQLDGDAHEFIHFAVDGATRMQTLINDLLAYSRVGTRGKPFAATDCAEILRRVETNLKVALEESTAQLQIEPLPTVHADPTQLTQLFQNLISNAVKFRGSTAPVVRVQAQREESARAWMFSVCDNGIGIEPQHFDRIFVIFQRLHTRQEYPGTGIGLAICKKIVERHGGKIWVQSAPGAGTTFLFTIPDQPEMTDE